MDLKHLLTRLPSAAAWVATHPVESAGRAVGFAKGVVVGGLGLVEVLRGSAREPAPGEPAPGEPAPAEPASTEPAPAEPAPGEPAPTEPASAEPGSTEPAPAEPAPTEPAAEVDPVDERTAHAGPERVVPPPSHEPPAEPPIDVVGETLAKEREQEQADEPPLLGGTQGEPHPVTRDEVHGEAPLVREEREEIDEETWEAFEDEAGRS